MLVAMNRIFSAFLIVSPPGKMTLRHSTNDLRGEQRRLMTALVLAGDRGPRDPVALATGASCRALSPVGGRPMILHVLEALARSEEVGKTLLIGPPRMQLSENRQLLEGIATGQWEWREPGTTPSASAYAALRSLPEETPVLVTTADHALLRAVILDHFCAEARQLGCDLVVAFVGHAQVMSAFPGMRRTAIRFRDGAFCGCNLYAFLTPEARKAADFWRQVEQDRKHPWRMIRMLGWRPLLAYLTGRLTLGATLEILGARLGLRICPVLLPFPEAAVDVDKPSDHVYVERILRGDQAR